MVEISSNRHRPFGLLFALREVRDDESHSSRHLCDFVYRHECSSNRCTVLAHPYRTVERARVSEVERIEGIEAYDEAHVARNDDSCKNNAASSSLLS